MADTATPASSDALLARFRDLPTSAVTDAFLRLSINGWMNGVLPLVPGTRITARARTIAYGPVRRSGKFPNTMYSLISRMRPGEVMVVGSGGTDDNLLGDNMATFAHRCGLAGIVTDSKTRDRVGLRELGMPVFSRGASARPPIAVELQGYDTDVDCGGAQVHSGDIILGDDDGVVVVPADRAEDILFQIEDLLLAEDLIKKTIVSGGSLEEIENAVARKKIVRK